MSGIVGSKINIRGSGRVAKLGTDGQVLTSSGAGKSANYEDGATSYDDDAVRDDIATLALHEATNANAAKYNLVNTNVDQYEDSTGVATFTDCSRDTTGEYVSTLSQARFVSDSDTMFLLHSNTTDGSTTFTDSSSNAHTINQLGGGGTEHSTDYPPPTYLGTTAIHGTGSGGLYMATSADWNMGTGDYCYEWWTYTNGTPTSTARLLSFDNTDQVIMRPKWTVDGGWTRFQIAGVAKEAGVYGSQPNDGVWTHRVLNRQGDVFRVYIDGVNKTFGIMPLTVSGTMFTASNLFGIFGRASTPSEYCGSMIYMTEMRISKGVSRYPDGTTFTPNGTFNATGNYISTATTANASVSSMGAVIAYKNQSGTNTLNTDIILEVSADSGSNYTTCVLTAAGTFSTGILQCVANDLAVTAGTGIQYRLSFANQSSGVKEARISGVSLMY